MQVLNPSAGGLYSGMSNAVSTISRIEGWRTLWRGVTSVIAGAGEDSVIRVVLLSFHKLMWSSAQVLRTPSISRHMSSSRNLLVEMLMLDTIHSQQVRYLSLSLCSSIQCASY